MEVQLQSKCVWFHSICSFLKFLKLRSNTWMWWGIKRIQTPLKDKKYAIPLPGSTVPFPEPATLVDFLFLPEIVSAYTPLWICPHWTHSSKLYTLFYTLAFFPFNCYLGDCSIISSYKSMLIKKKKKNRYRVVHKWMYHNLFNHSLLMMLCWWAFKWFPAFCCCTWGYKV